MALSKNALQHITRETRPQVVVEGAMGYAELSTSPTAPGFTCQCLPRAANAKGFLGGISIHKRANIGKALDESDGKLNKK
jgi:hypothetical protein